MFRDRVPVERHTAKQVLSRGQAVLLILFVIGVIVGLVENSHKTIIGLIAASVIFWTVFMGFRLLLWSAGRSYKYPVIRSLSIDEDLPSYTILVPLYKEVKVLPSLVEHICRLQYPKDKLQVLLLLEADDDGMWEALSKIALPAHFHSVKVPIPAIVESRCKSKPNALNVGLARATGEYCVIYDAEDRPDPDQLLKAVATFRKAPSEVVCLQARLAFWNGTSTWVTRFYWAEYVTHFEWVLAGMNKLGIVPPLGGTSNHFITERLREVAIDSRYLPLKEGYIGGWDPYNMTEDAELAAAFACKGYQVMMFDSTTWEEATARMRSADKQRRRWLKGYTQTGLVYTRQPIKTARQMGWKNWLFFNLIMLGTPLSLLLNPFFWCITVIYFATRTSVIERLFPLPLYYPGVLLMVLGTLMLFYQMVAACLKREGYGSVKYMPMFPVWWSLTSWSAYAMLPELVLRPHYWHKTDHGHDIGKEEEGLLVEQGIA